MRVTDAIQPTVLITCVGRRHYLARYFKDALAKTGGRLIGADMSESAPSLAVCDVACVLPPVFAPEYLDRLRAIIKEQKVDLVFSVNDLEIELLAANREALEQETGAVFYVPPIETARIGADKWLTAEFARSIAVRGPRTFLSTAAALEAVRAGTVAYPLMVKPRWGSGSIGLFRVESAAELETAFAECAAAVSRSILQPLGGQDAVIIQQFIVGPEYGVDLLYGRDEQLIGFAAKRKLAMRAGETDKAMTVPPARFEEPVRRIAEALRHRGNMDCDFLERDGELYLLELNPRFGGGYPFTHNAGADHVAMLLEDFLGRRPQSYAYEPGIAFAKYDDLVQVPVPSGRE